MNGGGVLVEHVDKLTSPECHFFFIVRALPKTLPSRAMILFHKEQWGQSQHLGPVQPLSCQPDYACLCLSLGQSDV